MLFSNRKKYSAETIDLRIKEGNINKVRECNFLDTVKDEIPHMKV